MWAIPSDYCAVSKSLFTGSADSEQLLYKSSHPKVWNKLGLSYFLGYYLEKKALNCSIPFHWGVVSLKLVVFVRRVFSLHLFQYLHFCHLCTKRVVFHHKWDSAPGIFCSGFYPAFVCSTREPFTCVGTYKPQFSHFFSFLSSMLKPGISSILEHPPRSSFWDEALVRLHRDSSIVHKIDTQLLQDNINRASIDNYKARFCSYAFYVWMWCRQIEHEFHCATSELLG